MAKKKNEGVISKAAHAIADAGHAIAETITGHHDEQADEKTMDQPPPAPESDEPYTTAGGDLVSTSQSNTSARSANSSQSGNHPKFSKFK